MGDIAKFAKGQGYSKSDLTLNGCPIILYGMLYTNYETVIDKVHLFVKEYINSIKSNGNEVIVPASGETAEDIARASAVLTRGIILGGDLNIIYPYLSSLNPTFLALSISNGAIKKELEKKAQGKSVVHIRNSDLQELLIKYPTLKEQTQIGNFFKQLDETIALHKRKLAKLFILKSAFLTSIFCTRNIQIYTQNPISWEQRKLGDISIFFSGGTPSVNNQNFYNGNIPFIRSGDIHSHDAEIFISQEALEYSSAKLVKKGDILYALYGATSGEVARSQLNGAINQAVLAIIPDKNQDPEFIMQWLARSKKYIIQNYLQGGQGNLSSEIVKKLQISKPKKLEEQTQIGNFFKQLDETIALHKRKQRKYEQIKQIFLRKMLID